MSVLLGYDIGSSSIKASLLDASSGKTLAFATSPDTELPMAVPQPGWAEQDPESWWTHIRRATERLFASGACAPERVRAIGIAYQMHGLVAVDKDGQVLRPAIIWCDSRAVEVGRKAAELLGREHCLSRLLNLPGNFTASKLRWVRENEPGLYRRIHKIMLPGDYVAYRMTDRMATTPSGLSEGILWDFETEGPARFLLDHFEIEPSLLAETVPTFAVQGELTRGAAEELGLPAGVPVAYRGGDQPNNALSLNVLEPGEFAVTAGTSGVVYGISDRRSHDPQSRVNVFVHVNHEPDRPRYGVLLCLNGTGILNSWLKRTCSAADGAALSYESMNKAAAGVPPGSEGLLVIPYGNGAERTLENRNPGASLHGLNFNVHGPGHLFRAAQEGIVYALAYGLDVMRGMGLEMKTARAGHANMFLSPVFAEVFATVTGAIVELYGTDGAAGAARGAGMGGGLFANAREAMVGLEPLRAVEPSSKLADIYAVEYARWKAVMERETEPLG